jgi:dihydroorotase-like cyclic amidohydrolase
VQTLFPELSPGRIYDLFGGNARTIFKLKQPRIEKKEEAVLTLFNPKESWQFKLSLSKSKSKNSAFQDHTITA